MVDVGDGVVEVTGDADVAVLVHCRHRGLDPEFLLQGFLERVDVSVPGFGGGMFGSGTMVIGPYQRWLSGVGASSPVNSSTRRRAWLTRS
ncbi:MAG: hypothetical protein CM1200mP2_52370 [Planctomycetaceae bacterium]|nr:MAG: hypothetical protein CM1200mP2_52370 [Planctomycetaceae bacterium]